MNSVTGVYFKVLLVLLVFTVIALIGMFLDAHPLPWYTVVLPLIGGVLGGFGGEIAVRKGWLVPCKGRLNCYRPKSMLLTVILCVVMVAGAIVLVGAVLFILAS